MKNTLLAGILTPNSNSIQSEPNVHCFFCLADLKDSAICTMNKRPVTTALCIVEISHCSLLDALDQKQLLLTFVYMNNSR